MPTEIDPVLSQAKDSAPAELPWYIAWIRKERATVTGAPFSFVSCVLICTVLASVSIFTIEQWHYSGTITANDATIVQKDAAIATITAEKDALKDANERLDRVNQELRTYRGKDAPPLKQNALILARQIKEFIKDWKDTDPVEKVYPNVQKYIQRFGLRTSIMRDDLDQNGQHADSFDKVMYDFEYKYSDVRTIADEIEKLAQNLPD